MERRFKPIEWDDGSRSLGNATPILLGGHVASRICKVLRISIEQGLREGDHRVITARHFEVDADEPVSVVVMEAAYLDSVRAVGGDDDFSHNSSSRGVSTQPTIAEGGVAANPVLNSRCRAPGGRSQ